MSLTFVIGRAGSGKTSHCLDEIRSKLSEEPIGTPLILLVPEQSTFQAEYELVTTPGLNGTLRAQALSFRRLAFRVMQECGGMARVHIDDTGKQMLLYKILQSHRDELTIFRKASEQRGFIAELNELFNEFRRYKNDASDLDDVLARADRRLPEGEEAEAPLRRKLQDIHRIYEQFERQLAEHYVDSEHYLQTLAEHAGRSAYLREAELWIDGFAGFTPQEYEVIGALMRSVKRVTVAICVDREYEPGEQLSELNMFYTTATTMIRLKEMAGQAGVKILPSVQLPKGGEPPRFRESPMLAHLEKHFADRHPPAYASKLELLPETKRKMAAASQVRIASAVNPRAEIDAVAREILKLVQSGTVRFRDIAVVTRSMDTYGDLIATVFADNGIPYFMDHKKSVMHHPVVELVRSAIEVVANNWRYDAIFRCVKTDLICDDRQAMDELENYALAFGIEGSRWTDGKCWEYAVQTSLDEDEPAFHLKEEELERIHRSRMLVATPLKRFAERLRAAVNVREQVTAVYELLDELEVPRKLIAWSEEALRTGHPEKAKEHGSLWNRLIGLFDQLVELLGDEAMSIEEFGGMLDAGLENMKLGLVPPSLDQVLVGTLDRTRFGRVRHVFVIGVNDGILPEKISEGGILSEAEREAAAGLGLQLAPDSRRRLLDEQFLAYTGFTLPSQGLWISYTLADEEGKSLLPSEYVRRIARMFPGVAEPKLLLADSTSVADEAEQADYLVHPERSLSHLIVQLRAWLRGGEIAPIWREALAWYAKDAAWRSRLESLLFAFDYTNQEQPLAPEISTLLYGNRLTASVSRMERFAACPFMQFVSHGLRLKERRIYRLEAPDIGQLFHSALSRMAKRLIEQGVRWRDLTGDELMKLADEAVTTVAPRLQSEILFSSERYQYMTRKLRGIVGRTARVLGEHARRGEFEPVALELGFGPGETLRPVTFTLSSGALMDLVGRIDRVDAAAYGDRELLRIIDYKSGAKSLSLEDVYYGLSLQLLAYLDVVVSQAEQWRGRPGVPAGALYFHVHNPLIAANRPMSDAEREEALLKQYKMKGLVAADREAIAAMDNKLEKGRSPIIPVGLKTDGGFYSDSQVADEQQWDGMRRLVRRRIKQIGEQIVQGNVEIKPYRRGKRSPCAYCAYRPVCQFDTMMEGNDYRFLPELDKQELWQTILQEKEEEA